MNTCSVRRSTFVVVGLGVALAAAACGEDKRIKQLDTGITRDSAVSVIAKGLKPQATADSFPNVYFRERFLVAGKSIEVLYFTPDNDKLPRPTGGKPRPIDSIPFKKLTPIVFVNTLMVGRGWSFWDSAATANKIEVHKHS